jgi:cell division protein FtsB
MAWLTYPQITREYEAEMTVQRTYSGWGMLLAFGIALGLGMYFTFAAVQGDYGIFRRAEIISDAAKFKQELITLESEVARMENATHRMSDEFLDLDLLDQQARDVLGYIGNTEIVIR